MNELTKIQTGERGLRLNTLEDMQTMSQLILQSGLCPAAFTKKEQVFVAIQSGMEIGLKPMQALNSICVIKGRPTIWGDAALGLVKRSGLVKEFSEEVTGEGDSMVATVISVRDMGGDPRRERESHCTTTFSAADAKTAGLWNKAGPWKTHPKRMLKYKARAFNLRDNFPDVLMGMHLTEEMEGEVDETLPAPECDTEPRETRRKKVEAQTAKEESKDVTVMDEVKDDAEPVATETDESADVAADSLFNPPPDGVDLLEPYKNGLTLREVMECYSSIGGKKFKEWAAEALCREEDEVEKAEQFTVEMLGQLMRELETKGV